MTHIFKQQIMCRRQTKNVGFCLKHIFVLARIYICKGEVMENIVKKAENQNSRVVLENRSRLSITGVARVDSTNETSIIIMVRDSKMCVSGSAMHITRLSIEEGVVEIEGTINSIKYSGGNVLKRIFK